jgi:hypothetical protein
MKILTLILVTSFSYFISPAQALVEAESSPPLRCGTISGLSGSVSILDSERKDYRPTVVGGPIFCGDWISTDEGKVVLDFPRLGKFTVGSQTFFQVLDPEAGINVEHDHFVLYRGDVYFEGGKKTNTVHLITPNTRVTLGSQSKGVVSFYEESHTSQVISIDGSLNFENRFLKHSPWKVERGYLSSMTQGQERILPGRQTTAESKSLDRKLTELDVGSETRKKIVSYVSDLAKKKMVVKLGEKIKGGPVNVPSEPREERGNGRSPASERHGAFESGAPTKGNARTIASVHESAIDAEESDAPKVKPKRREKTPEQEENEVKAKEKKRILENLSRITEEDTQ